MNGNSYVLTQFIFDDETLGVELYDFLVNNWHTSYGCFAALLL